MSHKGNLQLTIVIKATSAELVAQGDKIFESHAKWMEASHHRDGDKALLRYNVSKGPEYSNKLDPSSEPTGNTYFVLLEVYASEAGLVDHWKRGAEDWDGFGGMIEWLNACDTNVVHGCDVLHSLW
jgi:hypothetical protein